MGESKAKRQLIHFKRRVFERHNFSMNREDIKQVIARIQKHEDKRAFFIKKESLRLSWWAVFYKGRIFPVIYDKQRRTLVTTLAWEWIEQEHRTAIGQHFKELIEEYKKVPVSKPQPVVVKSEEPKPIKIKNKVVPSNYFQSTFTMSELLGLTTE